MRNPQIFSPILSLLLIIFVMTASLGQDSKGLRKKELEDEIVQSIFGTIEEAAKTLKYLEKKEINLIAEGFDLLAEEMEKPRKRSQNQPLETLDYRLGGIQDSFMNLDTFKIPKKIDEPSDDEGDRIVRDLLKNVWSDMAKETKLDEQNMDPETARSKLKLLNEDENLKRLEIVNNLHRNKHIQTHNSDKLEEPKKEVKGGALKIFITISLMMMVGFIAIYALKRMNRNADKKEKFDEERVPITKPRHFKAH